MSAWELAWRTVVQNPARALLAVGGVAVIGALLFTMLLLSRGLLVSFRDLLDTAGYDVRVMAAEGSLVHRVPLAGATSLANAIRRLPAVERVGVIRMGSAVASVPGGDSNGAGVAFIGSSENALGGAWDLVNGSALPDSTADGDPAPFIVSTKLASVLHLDPGSPLRIRVTL